MTTKTRVAATPTAAWRNRITGSGEEAPDQLLANPANWRIHPKAQQDALAGALDQVGWVQQVLVNRTTGHVVDGHLRVELAISRHERSVPVVYVELSEEDERLVLASLDPLAAMATAECVSDAETSSSVDTEGRVENALMLIPARTALVVIDPKQGTTRAS
jgi:hypothetical protein